MSNFLMNTGFRSKPGRKRKTKDEDKCLVCGGKSIGLNFGVHTCSPCKAFFRRNAVKLGTYEFQCRSEGNCPVTSDTRRQCNCCRLAKCFRVGMDRKAIRTADQRLERIQLIEYNRRIRAEEEFNEKMNNKQMMIRPCRLSTYSQPYLSTKDHAMLTNIFQAYERTCISLTYKEHISMPVDENLTLEKFLNASANIYLGLIYYLKSIPEFHQLSINNKLSLIKSNLNQILRIHSSFIMKIVTPDLDKDSPVFLHLFPEEIYREICTTCNVLIPFLHDPILIKLFIIVLMLSTHMNIHHEFNPIRMDEEISVRTILQVQNIYVDLLWRYILSRCGNYRHSVQLFSSFITRTLYSQIVQVKINHFVHSKLPNQCQSLAPIIKSIWASEKDNCS